jgi:hypothetical protein
MKRGFLVTFLVFALFSTVALAQLETGTVTGTVTDPTGAVVPNAAITITNTATNQSRNGTSSSGGEYVITNLTPGAYVVKVNATGFALFQQRVDVMVGSKVSVDARLAVGKGAGTVVEVTAAAAGTEVDTQSQTLGTTVTPTAVINLPSLTRNPYDFALTSGSVSEGDSDGKGIGVSINGARDASTNILLDGAENVDLFSATVGQSVPLDSVQEFKLDTSNFTAEYGRASGGVVNVATKSGTNQFHGSLYEYNRVSDLAGRPYNTDAFDWANKQQGLPPLPNSGFTRNQFGYSIGGPVIKDKLFFFSNTEWTRVRSVANFTAFIFDPQFLAQTGAATQAFYNAYGTRASGVSNVGSPMVAGCLAELPGYGSTSSPCAPGWTSVPTGSPNFVALATANPTLPVLQLVNMTVPTDSGAGYPQNAYSSVNRVDFNITNKTTLWGRYALYNEDDFAGTNAYSPYAGFNTGVTNHNQNILINLTHIFTPTIVNQAKVSYNRLNDLQALGTQPPTPSLYIAASVPLPDGSNSIYMPGYLPYSQSNAIPFGGPQNLYELEDQLTWTRGKHTFAFGGGYIMARDNRTFGAYEEGIGDLARSSGAALDAMLAGTMYSYEVAISPQGNYPCPIDITTDLPVGGSNCTLNLPTGAPSFKRNNRFNDGNFYAQDAWRTTKRLTVSLGLRWEYFGVQHNADPKLDSNYYYTGTLSPASVRAGFVSPAPSSPVGALWNSAPHNFGPRIGFAYDVFGDGKTSIRGGYGISYERNFGNVTFNVIQNPPNYAVVSLASPTGFTIPVNDLGPFSGTGTATLPAVTLRGVDPKIKTAYANMYSLAVEHEVIRNTVVAIEYSGSRGIHQYSITNINRYYGGPTYNGDPNINPTYVPSSEGGGGFQAGRTNTQFGNINFRGSNADSWYNGLNFRASANNLQSKGLTFNFNYTWSHSLDDLSSTFSDTAANQGGNFALGFLDWMHPLFDKASSDYDVRNRIALSGVYAPPMKFKNKAVDYVAGGWSIAPIWTWHSGTPMNLYDCGYQFTICARQLNGYLGTYSALTEPNPITTPNTFNYFTPTTYTPYTATVNGQVVAGNITGGVADDPSCTNGVCAFPSNMVRRNAFRAPNYYSLNLGVYKNFQLTERFGLQLRGEAYDLFNHSNYFLNYLSTDTEFGTPITAEKGYNQFTGIYERRNLQLALRLSF